MAGSVKSIAACPNVLQVRLALDHIGEHRRGSVLEIGHEHLGAGIERVDDHLAVDGAGDLDPAIEKVGGDRGDRPVALANGFGFGEKVRQLAGVEVFLPSHAPGEQLQAPAIEPAVQAGQKRKRFGRENFGLPAAGLGVDLDAGYSRVRCHEGAPQRRKVQDLCPRPFPRLWGGAVAVRRRSVWIRPRDRLPGQQSVRARTAA